MSNECPHCGAGPGEMCARLGFCRLASDGSSPHTREPVQYCEACDCDDDSVSDRTGPDGIGTLYLCDNCADAAAERQAERAAEGAP
jgi:hypothetical protein